MVAKGRFAMRPGLTLREDYDAARLRGVARRTKSAAQGRRLLALAEIYDGGSRTKAACVGGVGLQNKITRRWARRGTRPSAPHDQRTASTYIFGAICPGDGKGAALVLPACNTEAMNLHLAEIAAEVAPGKHAVLVVDQAGRHLSAGLVLPDNITLVVLPPTCPALNPAETVWP